MLNALEIDRVGMSDISGRIGLKSASSIAVLISYVVIFCFSLLERSPVILVAYYVFGIGAFLCTTRGGATASRIFLCVYGAATIAMVALFYDFIILDGVPYLGGGSDELHYEQMGKLFAEQLGVLDYGSIRGTIVGSWHNSVGYIYLIGLLTKLSEFLGGSHTAVFRLFNAACLALLAVMVYHLGRRLELEKKTAVTAALFAGCLPLMMWVTVQTLRDIVIALLLVGLVLTWTPDGSNGRRHSIFFSLLLSVLLIVPLLELRRPQALVGVVIVMAGLLTGSRRRRRAVWLLWIVAIGATAIWFYWQISDVVGKDVRFLLEAQETYSTYRVEATGGGLSTAVFTTPPPLGYVLRIGYAMISPLPVLSLRGDQLWLSLGTGIHFFFIFFLVRGLCLVVRTREWRVTSIAFGLLFVGMAMFSFQIRHITEYLPFAVLIAALGYERYQGRRSTIFVAMSMLGALLISIYAGLKV